MVLVRKLVAPSEPFVIAATPLTRGAFARFGDVISNPAPGTTPADTTPEAVMLQQLPFGGMPANQGTAIQYRAIGPSTRDLYRSARAPSGRVATPRVTLFVCGAKEASGNGVEIRFLERHPYTSQTFVPLHASDAEDDSSSLSSSKKKKATTTQKRYLVVVAPTLPPVLDGDSERDLPVPTGAGMPPGPGLPDLNRLTAFVATPNQAVTYAPGTWHAPMIAIGPHGSTVDFVVVQAANGVPIEDCQEVAFVDDGREEGGRGGIWVRVPQTEKEREREREREKEREREREREWEREGERDGGERRILAKL